MNGENIPLLAYFFVSVTSLVLAYVTYTDELSKIPGQIKQTVDSSTSSASSTLYSLTSGLSNPFSSSTTASSTSESSTPASSTSESLTALNPLAVNEENKSTMTGGKRKHKKTKRHHSKPNHNKTKHNKHNKCIRI